MANLVAAGKAVLTSAGKFYDKNAPGIFTGLSVAGTLLLIPATIYGTVKSMNDIYDSAEEDPDFIEHASKLDIVKKVWPNYIPTAIIAGTTIFSEIKSCHEGNIRTAAATAAAEFFKETGRTYKQEVIDQIGKNKEKKIQIEADKKEIAKRPPSEEFIQKTLPTIADNDLVFRDPQTGQYFVSNIDKVEAAAHKANNDMRNDRVWLNDLLYDCGASMSELGRDYYLDYYETGEIYVEDFIRYAKTEIHGHTFMVGTLDYNCKSRYD